MARPVSLTSLALSSLPPQRTDDCPAIPRLLVRVACCPSRPAESRPLPAVGSINVLGPSPRPHACSNKFTIGEDAQIGFNVSVAARFRPGATSERNDFVLPLHQRLKLRKPGEILTFAEAEKGITGDAIGELVGKGGQLPPELVKALLDAQKMGHMLQRARNDAHSHECHGMEFAELDATTDADAAAAAVAAVSVAALGIVVPGDTATMQATTPPPPQMAPDDPHEEMCKGDDQGQGQKVVKDKGEDKGEKMLDKGELHDDQ